MTKKREQEATPNPEPEPPVGVFVAKTTGENGGLKVDVSPAGIELTEVLTLLEMGLKNTRQALGLPPMR